LFSWSLDVLREGGCRPIIVALGPDVPESSLLPHAVCVGESRRASLLNALDQIEGDRVVLHDAVRPFAEPELVREVVRALDEADVAIAAVPVGETLKLVEKERVTTTVDRRHLWHPQTPQAYKAAILRTALQESGDGIQEAEAARRLGAHIVVVPGSSKNIRVSSGDDLKVAEAIAKAH
jgi:2-C-methyl-D-erythritol 4-phosphate cytidylyltransferase